MATMPWIAKAVDMEGMRVRRKGLRKLMRCRREVTSIIVTGITEINLKLFKESEKTEGWSIIRDTLSRGRDN